MTRGKGKAPGEGNLGKHIGREAKKERSQLESRKHLGALEKHKDYTVRARRRHKKVDKLQAAKRAAAQRNPDEFHMDMAKMVVDMSSGKIKKRAASKEERKEGKVATMSLNKNNINYLQHKAAQDLKRVEELSGEVFGLDMPAQNTHTIFVDEDEDLKKFDVAKHLNTTEDMLQYPAIRPNLDRLGSMVLDTSASLEEQKKLTRRQRHKLAKQLRNAVPRGERAEDEYDEEGKEEEDEETGRDVGGLIVNDDEDEDRRPVAIKMREIQQRSKRAQSLKDLAKKVERQNDKMHKSLHAKRNSKFKKGANVRNR